MRDSKEAAYVDGWIQRNPTHPPLVDINEKDLRGGEEIRGEEEEEAKDEVIDSEWIENDVIAEESDATHAASDFLSDEKEVTKGSGSQRKKAPVYSIRDCAVSSDSHQPPLTHLLGFPWRVSCPL